MLLLLLLFCFSSYFFNNSLFIPLIRKDRASSSFSLTNYFFPLIVCFLFQCLAIIYLHNRMIRICLTPFPNHFIKFFFRTLQSRLLSYHITRKVFLIKKYKPNKELYLNNWYVLRYRYVDLDYKFKV